VFTGINRSATNISRFVAGAVIQSALSNLPISCPVNKKGISDGNDDFK